jgi:tetratricopeptide (TPR) repeat protein
LKLFCDIAYETDFHKLDQNLQSKIKKFLDKIPKMPLDVCAAAYYLKNTKISLDDYEKIMQTSYRDLNEVQCALLEENVNYSKTRYSILSSIFNKILQDNQKFRPLLLLLGMLDSHNIPKSLLKSFLDSITVDKFIYCLRKNSLISDDKDSFSIHRSSQSVCLDYVLNILTKSEKEQLVAQLVSILSPYEYLDKNYDNIVRFIPHLKSFLGKIDRLSLKESFTQLCKIKILITVGNIYRIKECLASKSLKYFDEVMEINKADNCLSRLELSEVFLAAGEAAVKTNCNDKALDYLRKSFVSLQYNKQYAKDFANNYNLLGILSMRKGDFYKANAYFDKAVSTLQDGGKTSLTEISFAHVLKNKAVNISMYQVNKESGMKTAIDIMEQVLAILNNIKCDKDETQSLRRKEIVSAKLKLCNLYNGVRKYKEALGVATEVEKILDQFHDEDNECFCNRGILLMEQGHANLRLRQLTMAKEKFHEAKVIFDKAKIGDYIPRLRVQEAETLIRLGYLNEAYQNCQDLIDIKKKDENAYNTLFYNTSHYNAAVIKYMQGNRKKSLEHFKIFFDSMKIFCVDFLNKTDYEQLLKEKIFDFSFDEKNIKKCFENSLIIFKSVCMCGSEFITDYIEQNYKKVQN